MARKTTTNAARLLDRMGIPYEILEYDLGNIDFSAEAVADALGLPHSRVFKTLAATDADQVVLAVVPGDRILDLKGLARASGARKLELLPVADLVRHTGYRRGSVTALGTRRPLPVYLDDSALDHDQIAVSAGAPGLQLLITPDDYIEAVDAVLAPVSR